jgi:hypothetical protein
MQLAQDRVRWQSLRSTVMNLFVLLVLTYRGRGRNTENWTEGSFLTYWAVLICQICRLFQLHT